MVQHVFEEIKLDEKFPFAIFTTREKQQLFHYHDCLELNYVVSGSGCYIIDGKKYPVKEGDIFVINNKELHMAIPEDDSELTLQVLIFDMDLIWQNKRISNYLTPFLSRKQNFSNRIGAENSHQEEICTLFNRIEKEYEKQDKAWQMAVESLLMYLLTFIYRCYEESESLEEDDNQFQKMYSRISCVFSYIGEHFREEINLDTLARQVALSPNYLCKCFKNVTGKTIFVYIEQMRIQYSCHLLRTTRASIMEVALESGFNTVSYYNRMFKKYCGMTPGAYRKEKAR